MRSCAQQRRVGVIGELEVSKNVAGESSHALFTEGGQLGHVVMERSALFADSVGGQAPSNGTTVSHISMSDYD